MQQVFIHNQTNPTSRPIQAGYCDSFFSRLLGLMFRKSLPPFEGILLVQPRADRFDSAIHMFFMRFDITTVWTGADLRVVDVRLARRWRPAYIPKKAAKYVLETHAGRVNEFHIGDQLVLEPC